MTPARRPSELALHHNPLFVALPHGPARTGHARRGGLAGRSYTVVLSSAVLMLLTVGLGRNLDLALLSIAVFVVGSLILWRPGEAPVLVMIFGLHWLEASVAIFYANWLDLDILRYSEFGGAMRWAAALSLVGVLFVALGMRIGAGAWRPREAVLARAIAQAHPVSRWFKLYCLAGVVSFVAMSFTWVVPGLSQILLAVAALRWAFFFALAYASFVRGAISGPFLPIAFCGEFVLSLGSYFSDFRTVFFFAIYAAFASAQRLTTRMKAGLAFLMVALLCLGIVWSGVKEQYRQFASEGQKEQVTSVDYATRVGKLVELTASLDAQTIDAGVDKMLRRLSYIDFFSAVLDFVPSQVGHENGKLLADALTRPFLPRAFFPGKSAIDDTERTNFYTGGLAGSSDGTSISIGYIGETYIDFGSYGMMVALLAIGGAYGFAYRLLSRSKRAGGLIGMGLASAVLITVGGLDSSITKVAGGFVASLFTAGLIVRFAIPSAFGWAAKPDGTG